MLVVGGCVSELQLGEMDDADDSSFEPISSESVERLWRLETQEIGFSSYFDISPTSDGNLLLSGEVGDRIAYSEVTPQGQRLWIEEPALQVRGFAPVERGYVGVAASADEGLTIAGVGERFEELWSTTHPAPEELRLFESETVPGLVDAQGEFAVAVFRSPYSDEQTVFVSFKTTTGALLWSHAESDPAIRADVDLDGRVFIGLLHEPTIRVLDPLGTPRSDIFIGGDGFEPLLGYDFTLEEDSILVAGYSALAAVLRSYDADGGLLWEREYSHDGIYANTAIASEDGAFVGGGVGLQRGWVEMLDEDGDAQWRLLLDRAADPGRLVAMNRFVYMLDRDGVLSAYRF